MSRLLALLVLCGMCKSVLSDDDLKDCIFDFQSFYSEGDPNELILDFSGLGISTLTEGDNTYHYISGEFKTNSRVDSSLETTFDITKIRGGKIVSIYRDACEISADFYPQYLRPITATRKDVPSNSTICERDAGSIHVSPAKNSKDLVAPSKLDEGKYGFEVSYYKKDGTSVGGMSGIFSVIRV